MSEKQLIKDIGRKCSEDVAGAIDRNMRLVETPEAMVTIACYAAAAAFGAASGAFGAFLGKEPHLSPDDAEEMWQSLVKPMVLGDLRKLLP